VPAISLHPCHLLHHCRRRQRQLELSGTAGAQLPYRMRDGNGKLLESLLLCSTGVCSFVLHNADAARESAGDSLKVTIFRGDLQLILRITSRRLMCLL
jgi:hypothetical protein